jgi:hypothetical protein
MAFRGLKSERGFNRKDHKENKELGCVSAFMCLLPGFHFLASCFPQSQAGGPQAHDDSLLKEIRK